MKRIATPLAAALIAAGLGLPAAAQSTDSGDTMSGSDEETTSTLPGADTEPGTGTGAAYRGVENWAGVVSLLQTGDGAPTEFDTVHDTADVEVVRLTRLEGRTEEQVEVLDEAVDIRSDDIAAMRGAIEDHEMIVDALESADQDVADVIAAVQEIGGEVHVVVDDRQG
ncbi:hypothetical protein [Rhodosalinus sp.]|uniref:hypothetical protein n=1 Tax=Rhodosalinus sp. TaxID=2047741 RepID=UPI00356390F5